MPVSPSDYPDGYIHFNPNSPNAAAGYVPGTNGTITAPCLAPSDVLNLAYLTGINRVYCEYGSVFTWDSASYIFQGATPTPILFDGPPGAFQYVDLANPPATLFAYNDAHLILLAFNNITIQNSGQDVLSDAPSVQTGCVLEGPWTSNISVNCQLGNSYRMTLGIYAVFINCNSDGDNGEGSNPVFDMGGANAFYYGFGGPITPKVQFINFTGPLTIMNMIAGASIDMHNCSGDFTVDASCTGGTLTYNGLARIIDQSDADVSILNTTPISQGIVPFVVTSASPTAVAFNLSSNLSAQDHQYEKMYLLFGAGVNAGVPRQITAYTGSTKSCTFSTGYPQAPAYGDSGIIFGIGP